MDAAIVMWKRQIWRCGDNGRGSAREVLAMRDDLACLQ
ncbi:hypothetical protein MGWOODY_Hyp2454 [hydrothermal vent metagenome]|uniref:Uncharacterized protein n=1 Tax=hydrothermal vent metagenome TaxID=652676 RepID=A0A160U2C7_9ZZZZ